MKASFGKLSVRATLNGAEEKVDLTDAVAEAVYQNACTFEQHKLAHRIAESKDGIDLNEKEVATIKLAIAGFKFFVQKPILEALGEKFE